MKPQEFRKEKLPDGAYAALEGLQRQAVAATAMLPGRDAQNKTEAEKNLRAAQYKMAENYVWTKKIIKALKSDDIQTTVLTADTAWLERTFADHNAERTR